MNNKNFLLLLFTSLALLPSLMHAAGQGNNSGQPNQPTSWWPNMQTVTTNSLVGIVIGTTFILINEYFKPSTQKTAEKVGKQLTPLLEANEAIKKLAQAALDQHGINKYLQAQDPDNPVHKINAENIRKNCAQLGQQQATVVEKLNKEIGRLAPSNQTSQKSSPTPTQAHGKAT